MEDLKWESFLIVYITFGTKKNKSYLVSLLLNYDCHIIVLLLV